MLKPLRPNDPRNISDHAILCRLPPGGMADVFLARSGQGNLLAIKRAKADPRTAAQFAVEMETARRIRGTFIAEVVSVDPEAQLPWLASRYVPGPSLAESASDRPLPASSVRSLAAALSLALMGIHRCGIAHGDLTPRNILLRPDGPRVIDFGISALLEATTSDLSDRPAWGTPGFVAPEQYHPPSRPTVAGDVFALGGVMWFALTGEYPDPDPYVRPAVERLPREFRNLVRICRESVPAGRPTPAQVLELLGLPPDGSRVRPMFGPNWLPGAVVNEIRLREQVVERLRLDLTTALAQGGPRATVTAEIAEAAYRAATRTLETAPVLTVSSPVPHRPGRRLLSAVVVGAVLVMGIIWAALAGQAGERPSALPTTRSSRVPAAAATMSPVVKKSPVVTKSAVAKMSDDPQPCRTDPDPPASELPVLCPLVWSRADGRLTAIPVFGRYDAPDPVTAQPVDWLRWNSGAHPPPQHFRCHVLGSAFSFAAHDGLPAAHHTWWALTQGDDHDIFGFVSEVYLDGGADDVPDGGDLPVCSASDVRLAGHRP
jgi:serine/threonine protein kinase